LHSGSESDSGKLRTPIRSVGTNFWRNVCLSKWRCLERTGTAVRREVASVEWAAREGADIAVRTEWATREGADIAVRTEWATRKRADIAVRTEWATREGADKAVRTEWAKCATKG